MRLMTCDDDEDDKVMMTWSIYLFIYRDGDDAFIYLLIYLHFTRQTNDVKRGDTYVTIQMTGSCIYGHIYAFIIYLLPSS
jgi:hypothetical protein